MGKTNRNLNEATMRVASCLLIVTLLGVTACGGGTNRPQGAEGNSSEIGAVELSPQPVYANNDVTVLVTPQKANTSPNRYVYRWHKNGEDIDVANGATLSHTLLRKGDVIAVTVTEVTSEQPGVSVTSKPVTVRNSPPTVTAVGIMPSPLYQHMDAHAVVHASDNDDDNVSYAYQWLNNGTPLEDQTAEMLDGAMVAKGSHLQVQVTPLDGEATGDPRRSPVVTVQNSPPRITSQPTTSLNDEDTYIYRVVAEDPDGGPVTYSLKSAPERMTIDPAQGTIRWTATKEDAGIHAIEIVAKDAEGAEIIQRYELQIFDLQDKSAEQPAAASPSHS
jgi:Putative Ig domain